LVEHEHRRQAGATKGADVSEQDDELVQLMLRQRVEAVARREGLGPIIEAVGMLRACCETIRVAADELESSVGVQLELLDHVLVNRDGIFWWDRLHDRPEAGGA
jgi:hypothetical protein